MILTATKIIKAEDSKALENKSPASIPIIEIRRISLFDFSFTKSLLDSFILFLPAEL
jgi:hypothetical protein